MLETSVPLDSLAFWRKLLTRKRISERANEYIAQGWLAQDAIDQAMEDVRGGEG